jgi:hypothetical protein
MSQWGVRIIFLQVFSVYIAQLKPCFISYRKELGALQLSTIIWPPLGYCVGVAGHFSRHAQHGTIEVSGDMRNFFALLFTLHQLHAFRSNMTKRVTYSLLRISTIKAQNRFKHTSKFYTRAYSARVQCFLS